LTVQASDCGEKTSPYSIAQINIKSRNSGSIDISILSTPIVGDLCTSPLGSTPIIEEVAKYTIQCAGITFSDDRSLLIHVK